jgi:hypothetical protein
VLAFAIERVCSDRRLTTMNTLAKPPNLVSIIESRLSETERDAAILALRARPDATIRDLAGLLESKHAATVGAITLAELTRSAPPSPRQLAELARGPEFDAIVLAVITSLGRQVGASEITEHVGGPRWKLHASLTRLVDSGSLQRSGSTSGTRYWVGDP